MSLLPPNSLECLVAIGAPGKDGGIQYDSTGFLYGLDIGPGKEANSRTFRIYLVTNRHVFDGRERAWLRFNTSPTSPGEVLEAVLIDPATKKPTWLAHLDASVDIAVAPISSTLLVQKGIQFRIFQSNSHV